MPAGHAFFYGGGSFPLRADFLRCSGKVSLKNVLPVESGGRLFPLRADFLRRSGKIGAKNTARVDNRVSPTPAKKIAVACVVISNQEKRPSVEGR